MDSLQITNTALLFDFDGTMYRLFANYDLKKVILELRETVKKYGVDFSLECDSFDIFSEVIRQTVEDSNERENALFEANQILTNAEIEAIGSGELVDGVERVFPYLKAKGYSIGIATNNSAECINAFLEQYCSNIKVPVAGRIGTKPNLMKPNPWSIFAVLRQLNRLPQDAIFIGDTQRDFFAAKNVGCKFIGMAPTSRKREKLLQVISDSDLVSNYWELLDKLK